MSVRIWKFPAVAPGDRATANDLLYGASRYYNRLVEIERNRLAAFAALRRDLAPDLAAYEDEYTHLDEEAGTLSREIKRLRADHYRATRGDRSRTVSRTTEERLAEVQEQKKRVSAEAKPLRRAFSKRLRPVQEEYRRRAADRAAELADRPPGDERPPGPRHRATANAEVLADMLADEMVDEAWRRVASADAAALDASKQARAECGLPPGCYLVVEEAVKRAKKDSGPEGPRFRRSTGEGRIAVQLRGATWADVLAGTSMLRVMPAPRIEGKRGRQEWIYCVRIRVGTGPGREPKWLETTARIDRQPPPDARVAWAWLRARRQGERMRWELQLVLDHSDLARSRPAGIGDGGHVRLGWGATPDGGVRVATWPGGDMVLPHAILRRADHAELLLGHADRYRDQAERVLRLWLHRAGGPRLPLSLRGERARLWLRRVVTDYARHTLGDVRPLWRAWVASSPADLFASLPEARAWMRSRGFTTTESHLSWWLLTWARKDRHLRQWAADTRARFERSRDALYRETAIRLATQYETVTIDSYSIAKLKTLPSPITRSGDVVIEAAQRQAQLAAPGRFREILLDVMGKRCTPRERSGVDETTVSARSRRDHSTNRRDVAYGAARASPVE